MHCKERNLSPDELAQTKSNQAHVCLHLAQANSEGSRATPEEGGSKRRHQDKHKHVVGVPHVVSTSGTSRARQPVHADADARASALRLDVACGSTVRVTLASPLLWLALQVVLLR